MTNEVGNRYGKLIVISRSGKIGRDIAWSCVCDCGKTKRTRGTSLRMGRVKSCGCIASEIHSKQLTLHKSGEGAFNSYYWKQKYGAEIRGYSWELTREQVKNINSKNCEYCGNPPSQIFGKNRYNGDYIYNGIDRVDNTVGYEINNCVPCCGICNRLKSKFTIDEFKSFITRVYNHWVSR